MNRKKIHKILIKLGIILCIVGQLTLQVSMMAIGGTLVESDINHFGEIPKCQVEYKVKSNDTVSMKQTVIVSKDNKNIKIATIKKSNTLTQYGEKNMLTGKVGGEYKIHEWYQNRLNNLATCYNKEINIFSGYRSKELQQQLYNQSDKSGRMVAESGKSRHNVGLAVDVTGWATELTNKELAPYGLYKPMSYENWHIEPIETKGKSTQQLIAKYGIPNDAIKKTEKGNSLRSLIEMIIDKEIQRIDRIKGSK